MNKDEKWTAWNPTNIAGDPAYYVEIFQEEEATRFTLDCEHKIIDVLFYGFVPIYLYSVEGIRMATWASIQEKEHDRFYFQKWFLYRIENSDFLDWAIKEGCGFYKKEEFMHYCIVTQDDVVDILANCEPVIVVRDKN